MPAIAISPQRREDILNAFRRGSAPATSLDILAVGLEPFEVTLPAEPQRGTRCPPYVQSRAR